MLRQWKYIARGLAATLLVASLQVVADEETGEKASGVDQLSIIPAQFKLRGKDSNQQLVVTAHLGGKTQDVTHDISYKSSDEKTLRIDSQGVVYPVGNGKAEVIVSIDGKEARASVEVEKATEHLPINFANQVVPLFTKLGCNSGGCHGKASGQNGFKISLLGFEPDIDFEALVKEARGRRLFPAAPERSLLLQKAISEVPHGGGKRTEKDSHEYNMIARWIASGMPYGSADDPKVTKITVDPPHRILGRGTNQQITVTAHYSDGTSEDVTRHAQYESNEPEVANVDESGLVQTLDLSGEAGVMARYQGNVSVFRATVPLGKPIDQYPEIAEFNFLDRHTIAKWKQLGVIPSGVCSDREFIRRVMLDVCGTLPTVKEVSEFAADTDPDKRKKLVDRLLERPEYADYFALKWADILRVKRGNNANFRRSTYVFSNWIREQLYFDRPYTEFVREIIAAQGDVASSPPVTWYREIKTKEAAVDDVAQVFLGLRIQCARCHHHPFEKWSQDDYYSFAAFFSRVGRKGITDGYQGEQRIYALRSGESQHPKTKKVMKPRGLDGPELDVPADEDRRQHLADWLSDPENPFFAKAAVNRMWAHFFSRGIVSPEDDMRVTNPPSNSELLDALAKNFIENGYRLKHLIRTIVNSRTYQLSSIPNDYNKHDKQNYARYYPKRMQAEVLHDALVQVTGSPTKFSGLPASTRAISLPDEASATYFLKVFGKPERESACECERVGEANLAQSLHLLNSTEIQGKISGGKRITGFLGDKERPDPEKLKELWLACFARTPSEEELKIAMDHIDKKRAEKEANVKIAYEDIIWALLNTKEFLFVD